MARICMIKLKHGYFGTNLHGVIIGRVITSIQDQFKMTPRIHSICDNIGE